jgi:hypothetical protein
MLVAVEVIGLSVICDVEIGPTVVIVVAPDRAQSEAPIRIADAGFLAHVLEGTVATVVEQEVRFAVHAPGSLDRKAFVVGRNGTQLVDVGMDVARDEEIDATVAIIISPGCSRCEAADAEARFIGDVFELASPKVAVEDAAVVSGNEDIEKAVVVIIGDGNAHAPAAMI